MLVKFCKYHALQNDFLIIEQGENRMGKARLERLAQVICHRKTGVGADGILYLSGSKRGDRKIDVFNADGSWAEKSGNGLRIAGVHECLNTGKKTMTFETAVSLDQVVVRRTLRRGKSYVVSTNLGEPEFRAEKIPVKTRSEYMINMPLKLAGINLPVTCVAVGNPHVVLFVKDFAFDWETVGSEIEKHPLFPQRTNVEFACITGRRKVRVAEWERGAGATGSSGTGAAAVVCAGVIMGLLERRCEVQFAAGSLMVEWREDSGTIELTGPVEYVAGGVFDFR
jgi:diaminopimelate epimerase